MKMPQHIFDDLYISALTCAVGRTHVEYFDTHLRGLYVDVMQSGKKVSGCVTEFQVSLVS